MNKLLFALLMVLLAAPNLAFAQAGGGSPSLDQMFNNFSSSAIAIMNLVRWSALPVGIYVSVLALIRLKELTEQGSRVKPFGVILLMFAGAALISFPLMTSIVTQTMSLGEATGTSLSRVPASGGSLPGMQAALDGVLLFVKLVGHIAFFRGFLILKGVAEGAQGAGVGRAITHILGGAACINIGDVISMLAGSVGFGMLSGM